jgi:hypothetical protein
MAMNSSMSRNSDFYIRSCLTNLQGKEGKIGEFFNSYPCSQQLSGKHAISGVGLRCEKRNIQGVKGLWRDCVRSRADYGGLDCHALERAAP